MKDFSNKVAVITGAAGGLGKSLAKELYHQGCHLALIDINREGLERIRTEFANKNQRVSFHVADISKENELVLARQEILEQHQHLNVLVNNAGISVSIPFEKMEIDDFKKVIDTNFWGTVYCTKTFLPDLRKENEANLVNIISEFAILGFPGKTAYASSKAAIMAFTNCLHTELAESNVRVSLVVPPALDTGLVINSKHINDEKRKNESDFLKKHGLPLDQTARKIVRAIRSGKFRIVIGSMTYWADLASRSFPSAIHRGIGKRKKNFDFT